MPRTADPERTPFGELPRHERRRRTVKSALTIFAIVSLLLLAYAVSPSTGTGSAELIVRVIGVLILVGGATTLAVRSVMHSEYPMLKAAEALVTVLSLLIVLFAYVYLVASNNDPASFSEPLDHTRSMYFTVTTITTVGFGDITPQTNPARIAMTVQMVCNVVLIGAVARLLLSVARHASDDL